MKFFQYITSLFLNLKRILLHVVVFPCKAYVLITDRLAAYHDAFNPHSVPLRQPEVSITAKQLEERDWINIREEKKTGKGRPNKVYSLKVGFKDIIAQLEKQQKIAVDEGQVKIKRLKELGK